MGLDHDLSGSWNNAATWATAEASTNSGKQAKIVRSNLNVEVPHGTPNEVDDPDRVGGGTLLTDIVHAGTVKDYNVNTTNNTFYETANGNRYDIVVYQPKNENLAENATVYPNCLVKAVPANIPLESSELQHYLVTFETSREADDFPELVDVPASVFAVE